MTVHFPDAPKNAARAITFRHTTIPARTTQFGIYRSHLKRLFDVTAILATSMITLPVILLMALIVMRDGHSPFYRQRRVGRDGRIYNMLKIRTMVPEAEAKLDAYLDAHPEARNEWDATQKLKSDPRITKVGCFLRKSSLDELPQLWNVLKGDMALVGPRPMMERQRALYPGTAYYTLRPGITGLWQISDRNQTTFADRDRFDSDYARRLSFGCDLRILWRTVAVVIRATGY